MADFFDPNNDGMDRDPNDPFYKEEEEIKKQVRRLVDKIQMTSNEPVTNEDLLQYVRIINFNFANMNKVISAFFFRLSIVEESLEKIHKKLDSFLESNSLIEESLSESNSSDEQKFL